MTAPALRAALDRALAPRAVAVLGASARPDKLGHRVVDGLLRGGFTGAVHPVNPRGGTVCGLPAARSLAAVPGPVDAAVLAVPAAAALEAVRACAARGVAVAVVIASGFAEASVEGARLQAALTTAARAGGLRLVGPNCEGLVDLHRRLVLSFNPAFVGQRPGPVSIVSQSGACCAVVASGLTRAGLGAARIVSSGNEGDLAAVDYVEYLADDRDTRAILLHVETVRRPARLVRAVAACRTPVVVSLAGRTGPGRRQARRHSGARAGTRRPIDAALRAAGAVLVQSMDELVDAALALATQPSLGGRRVAVLSSAGGLAVEAADLLDEAGFALPALGAATRAALDRHVPSYGSTGNPVDFTVGLSLPAPVLDQGLAAVLADPAIDAVALLLTALHGREAGRLLAARVAASPKPVLVGCPGDPDRGGAGRRALCEAGVPVFDSTARLVRGLAALRAHGRGRRHRGHASGMPAGDG